MYNISEGEMNDIAYIKNKREIEATLTINYLKLKLKLYIAIKLCSLLMVLILCNLWSFLLAISMWNGLVELCCFLYFLFAIPYLRPTAPFVFPLVFVFWPETSFHLLEHKHIWLHSRYHKKRNILMIGP